MAITLMDCCKVFWAIFFPPLAVCLHRGCCTCSVLINICLTILGWIPGVVHAFCVISDCDVKTDGTYDEERAASSNTAAAAGGTAAAASQPSVVVVANEGERVNVKETGNVTVVTKESA
jgi:uncharacterized membrane protein YqaE (UPF0057 family)